MVATISMIFLRINLDFAFLCKRTWENATALPFPLVLISFGGTAFPLKIFGERRFSAFPLVYTTAHNNFCRRIHLDQNTCMHSKYDTVECNVSTDFSIFVSCLAYVLLAMHDRKLSDYDWAYLVDNGSSPRHDVGDSQIF